MRRKRILTRKKGTTVYLLALAGAIIIFAGGPGIVPAAELKVPKTVSIMTYELGSTGYISYGFIGEYMIKKYGTKLRAIPAGNDTARMIALRVGTAQFAGQGLDIYFAMEGISPRYSTPDWGPQQDVRYVWMAQASGQALPVRGNSNIHSVADLKGKKIGWIPGSVINDLTEAHLAYANLTWDDVQKVNMPSYGSTCKGIIDGSTATCIGNLTSSLMYELESSPYGIRYLPEDDKEGLARIQAKLAPLLPWKATIGAGVSESNPAHCLTYAYPTTVCYASLDEDVAYFMTKVIHEGYDTYAAANEQMKHYWGLDSFVYLYENSDFAILHPGTERYLKEIGAWKPAYDKFQKERTRRYVELRAFFEKVIDEAIENKIKAKNFSEFWLEKRAAFLEAK